MGYGLFAGAIYFWLSSARHQSDLINIFFIFHISSQCGCGISGVFRGNSVTSLFCYLIFFRGDQIMIPHDRLGEEVGGRGVAWMGGKQRREPNKSRLQKTVVAVKGDRVVARFE